MEKEISADRISFIDIRYNLVYSVCILILSLAFALILILSARQDHGKYFLLFFPFLLFVNSILALSGYKYIRLDPAKKRIIFYGVLGFAERKLRYDSLFFIGKDLYREIEGKKKLVSVIWYQCRKRDVGVLRGVVGEGNGGNGVTGGIGNGGTR